MQKAYYVYIMASKRNGMLYIGVTHDLSRRAWEHREGLIPGFTTKYKIAMLVYYEGFNDIHETQLKKYKRAWKMNLIQRNNLEWKDFASSL